MKVVLDGRKVGKNARGCYFEDSAYFSKRGLNKRFVLHEFCHHLVYVKGLDMPNSKEEKDASNYAREFLRSRYYWREKIKVKRNRKFEVQK